MSMVRFDSTVDTALDLIRARPGGQGIPISLVRAVGGQLTAVLPDGALEPGERRILAAELHRKLGPYSPGLDAVLLGVSDLIDSKDVLESPDRVRLPVEGEVWLVDRVLTNQDWLRKAADFSPPIPLAVGYSLKGGVGRSTALAVLAWHLARRGKNVLVVDLDLEAPGLGSLLLDNLPGRGVVDWLVEALNGRPDADLLEDCLAMSALPKESSGMLQVMPALGRDTQEYVAKIGRIYFPTLSADGAEEGLSDRLRALVRLIAARPGHPDLILMDARAGLHDVGAAAVSQLGAEVFVFARDEPQSWHTHRLLFEHLAKSRSVEFGMPNRDLRWRLKMVAAQLDKTEDAFRRWVDASYNEWSALYDDESRSGGEGSPAQTFVRDDPQAPHHPLPIYFEGGLRGASFCDADRRPAWPAVEAAFGPFLEGAVARLLSEEDHPSGLAGVRLR
jgi:cellulose biosynthesis protein BcsQ